MLCTELQQSTRVATLGRVVYAEELTPRQERDLVIGAEAGDEDATRKLVEAYLPAVVGVAAGFPDAPGVERRELVQEGVARLLFAARRYDSRFGTPFWAYASFWVRKGMQELVAELARPVALSDRAVRSLALLRRARSDYVQVHSAEPTDEQLSSATGLTRAQVESLRATERRPRALEEPLAGEAEATVVFGDTIADPVAEHELEEVLDAIEIHEVRSLADELDERERDVLLAHYGLGRPVRTLSEIGATLGLTAERARQIEVEALKKLREGLAHAAPVRLNA